LNLGLGNIHSRDSKEFEGAIGMERKGRKEGERWIIGERMGTRMLE